MKTIFVIALLASIGAYAATRTEDGGITLTPEETEQTIQYIRQIQATAIISQKRIIELENEVKLLRNTRCM